MNSSSMDEGIAVAVWIDQAFGGTALRNVEYLGAHPGDVGRRERRLEADLRNHQIKNKR